MWKCCQMNEWWKRSAGLVSAHLSINVCLCVELKLPKIKFGYGPLIIIWRGNRPSRSDCYILHFASCKKWMMLSKKHINQSREFKWFNLITITVLFSCDTFINVRKSWTPLNISATSFARSTSNPLFLWEYSILVRPPADETSARAYNMKWHRRCSSIGINELSKSSFFEVLLSRIFRCTAKRYKYVRLMASRLAIKSGPTDRASRIRMGWFHRPKVWFNFDTIFLGLYDVPASHSKSMCAVVLRAWTPASVLQINKLQALRLAAKSLMTITCSINSAQLARLVSDSTFLRHPQ